MDLSTFWSIRKNRISVLFLGIFFLLLLVVFVLFLSGLRQKNQQSAQTAKQTPPKTSSVSANVRGAPTVFFQDYRVEASVSSIPSTLNAYILKSSFLDSEIVDFARKFGLQVEQLGKEKTVSIYRLNTSQTSGVLQFDRETGMFSYQSYGVLRPKAYLRGQSPVDEALLFLGEIGMYDDTIACNVTYRRLGTAATFVECHRDWNRLGAPLVNLGGVLNIAENKTLGSLHVGQLDTTGPNDKDVYGASTGENGKARPNDFNTITVGVFPDGRIQSVTSSLRWITQKKEIDSVTQLISSEEAMTLLQNHKATFSLTIPTGTGSVDWNKLYPNNTASGKNAVITDIALVYLEKPMHTPQIDYAPYYVIRGVATLSSGYGVRFVQAIAAEKEKLSFNQKTNGIVAGAQTELAQNQRLKLDAFIPTTQPSPSVGSQRPTSTPTGAAETTNTADTTDISSVTNATGTPATQCLLPNQYSSSLAISVNVPDYGVVTFTPFTLATNLGSHTYYFVGASKPDVSLEQARQIFFKLVEDQYVINVAGYVSDPSSIRSVGDVKKLFNKVNFGSEENPQCSIADLEQQVVDVLARSGLGGQYEPYPSVPIHNCIPFGVSNPRVADNVARRIFEAARSNKIRELAAKPNIFPPQTLVNLSWLLSVAPNLDTIVDDSSCYISGASPAIFLYPTLETNVSVTLGGLLTYTDPLVEEKTWHIKAAPDGSLLTSDSLAKKYLYYEYDSSIHFAIPEEGFLVPRAGWRELVQNKIAGSLGLSEHETERLLQDVTNALVGQPESQYLKLSLVDQRELNAKLPVTILPKPNNLYRFHLLISPIEKPYTAIEPKLPRIIRDGFTVVEVGARMAE